MPIGPISIAAPRVLPGAAQIAATAAARCELAGPEPGHAARCPEGRDAMSGLRRHGPHGRGPDGPVRGRPRPAPARLRLPRPGPDTVTAGQRIPKPMPPPVIPSQAHGQQAPGRMHHAGAGPAAAHRAEITATARGLAHQQLTPALMGAG